MKMNNAPQLIKSPVMSKFAIRACGGVQKISILHACVTREIQITRDMEASVVMKEDKKMKIKTFSTGYAQSDSAFFCKNGFAECT